MKKIFVVLIALSLALSLYSQGAQEAVVEQKEEAKVEDIVVYAKVPAEWRYATIWACENASG